MANLRSPTKRASRDGSPIGSAPCWMQRVLSVVSGISSRSATVKFGFMAPRNLEKSLRTGSLLAFWPYFPTPPGAEVGGCPTGSASWPPGAGTPTLGVSALTKSARSTAQAGDARCWTQSAFSILRGITWRSTASKRTPVRCLPASSAQRAFRFARSSAGSTVGMVLLLSGLPGASFGPGPALPSAAASVARGPRALMKSARSRAHAGNTLCWMHRPLRVFRGMASRSMREKRISPRCSGAVRAFLAAGSSLAASSCCAKGADGGGAFVPLASATLASRGGTSGLGSGARSRARWARGARTWSRWLRSTVPGGSTPRWVQRAQRAFVGMPSSSASVKSCWGSDTDAKVLTASEKRGPSHIAACTRFRNSG
mmetsp:Transcript_13097/g.37368  ORF Transcript_13097/g.37368 Transcript_13097/m.37368 type:complete len:370 (+) Transcript_13097:141-1250(+)